MAFNQWKKIKQSGSFTRKRKEIYSQMSNIFPSNNLQNTNVELSNRDNRKHVQSMEITQEDFLETMVLAENEQDVLIPIIENDSLLNNSEDDSEKEKFSKRELIIQKLKKWSTSYNIRQTALRDLMKIINFMEPGTVPCDPRTLLETPAVVFVKQIGDHGKYWHQGLFTCLQYVITKLDKPLNISLNINIDGLPIAKSSREEFWPILCSIHEIPDSKPMVIGIYQGQGKPVLNEYLHQFVEELKTGINDGMYLNGHLCFLKVRAFICDSPARAFIKGTANYNSQNGCLKCTTVGEYSYISRTNIFPRAGCPKRTDVDFRAKVYELHHKCTSPLEQLPIDMVEDFPVSDSLHLLDLGIMKRCLFGWRDGTFNKRAKWSAKDIQKISVFLSKCQLPREIHRSVRPLDCLAHWKGTEYRSFFYYIGIVILKTYLPVDVYSHFLLLFCAITICSSIHYFEYIDVASKLLESYVERYRDIYGEEFLTSNVHNLTHLVDEVKRFGPLSTFNAYPFENMLYQIKLLLRQGNNPLVQVAKRIHEINQCETETKPEESKTPSLKSPINNQGGCSKLHISDNFLLSTDFPNRWFLTNEIELIMFNYAFKGKDEKFYISGQKVQSIRWFFEKPFISSFIFIYECCVDDLESEKIYCISNIKCKMVAVTYNETTTVFIPLLHTIDKYDITV